MNWIRLPRSERLNAIDGGNGAKAKRIPGREFEARLAGLLEGSQV